MKHRFTDNLNDVSLTLYYLECNAIYNSVYADGNVQNTGK